MKSRLTTYDIIFAFVKNALPLMLIGIIAITLARCSDPSYEKVKGVWETKLSDDKIAVIIVEDQSFIILDTFTAGSQNFGKKYKFTLDSGKTPKQFNVPKFGENGEEMQGIFEISDKRMKLAFPNTKNALRPSTFNEKETWLFNYKGTSADFVPVDSDYIKGVKTWNYWIGLNEINNRNNPGNPFANAKTPDQAIAACNRAIQILGKMRSEINALPVSDVDMEVTSYVSEYLNNLNSLESTLRELVSIVEDAQELEADSNPDEIIGMSIIEAFLGTPGTTLSDLTAEWRQIKNRVLMVQNKAKQGSEESDRLGAQQLKLRSSLSKKYNREFPQFKI